jgi:hypothetical protein
MKNEVTLLVDGDKIKLKDVLVGGTIHDSKHTYVGMYQGQQDLVTLGTALLHVIRGAFRTGHETLKLESELTTDFICYTVAEAIRLETEKLDEPDTDRSFSAFIKRYSK